jgi:hypothetical protein
MQRGGGVQWVRWHTGVVQSRLWQAGGAQCAPRQVGGGGVQSRPRHVGGAQRASRQVGGGGLIVVVVVAPPRQVELASPSTASETLQTLTGTLTGALMVLPLTSDRLPTPVVSPLLPPAPPDPVMVVLEWDPPVQCELAAPATAPETPQMLTGTLTGALTVLPFAADRLPIPEVSPLLPPAAGPPPEVPPEVPAGSMVVFVLAPPWQPAEEPPSTPTPTPQRSIGTLTGRLIPLPFRSERLPRPVVSPLGPAA